MKIVLTADSQSWRGDSCYACIWLPRTCIRGQGFVGYIEILRYTSELPLGGLESSFFLDTRLQSCSLVAPSCCPLLLSYLSLVSNLIPILVLLSIYSTLHHGVVH